MSNTLRKLRTAFSFGCGIVCLLCITLWVRSYWKCDIISHSNSSNRVDTLGSNYGYVYAIHMNDPPAVPRPHRWMFRSVIANKMPNPFEWTATAGLAEIKLPYRYLTIAFVALAVVPWLPWRFSLRTLLIVTTLLAVVLGGVVAFP